MAKTTATKEYDTEEPNLVVPLGYSYNTRGIDAYTNMVTNAIDQRKINCIYEPVTNAMGGNTTLAIAKRPGVAQESGDYGATGQVAYLVEVGPAATPFSTPIWVFSTDSNDVRVSDTSTTTVIFTAANYIPVHVDKTIVSATNTVVLQARHTSTLAQRVWYASEIGSWTEITDADFAALTITGKMEFLDGYAFILDSNNRIYNSDLGSLANWSATNFLTKQITQDQPRGLAKYKKQILAFGWNTMEVFRNVGNATGSPLESVPDMTKHYGLAAEGNTERHYYTTYGDWMFFIGRDPRALFAYNGETIEKVSNPAIDKIIYTVNVTNVGQMRFGGQVGIALSLSTASSSTQRGLIYFPEWKDWFEWTSADFQMVTSDRLGRTFLGVGSNGHKLYSLSVTSNNWQDNGTDYTMSLQFKLPGSGNQIKRMAWCGVEADTARSSSSLSVSWSDDDYQNFTTARTIDLTSATKMLKTCGSFRNRVMKLTHTGNLDCRMTNFLAKIV